MRKLLLASAAVIGGFAGGQAIAQTATTPAPLPPGEVFPPTWSEAPQPTVPSGIAAANSNLNAQGFYTKGPLPAPAPGTVVVRFNGRVVFYGFAENQTGDTNTVPASTTYAVNSKTGAITATTTPAQTYKQQPYGTLGYLRLYTGVDGMTVGGLRYGAAAEVRVDISTPSASATSGGASAGSHQNTLYQRRAFIYVGGDWGAIHFGQDDGPMGLLDAGVTTFQTYNDGGWNDDVNDPDQGGSPSAPVFPFPSSIGNEYTTSKIVYLSPQIAGFDFMASFEPSDTNLYDATSIAQPGSQQLSSGTSVSDVARRRNTYEAGLRYQGAFGPAGIYAFGSYIGSGRVNRGAGAPALPRFDNLSAIFTGAALNFGGFRVGGAFLTGAINNQMALKPDGAANEVAWLVGTQYTLGPMTVGASYFRDISAGALASDGAALGSQRRQGGINVGGTYILAPGLLAWLSASYGTRYQGGWNFIANTTGTANNNTQWKVVALGAMVRW